VTGTVNAALPSVAVTQVGSAVGVLYYTFNGMVSGFPQFTTWLAASTDQGVTFNTQSLATFLSPTTDNGDPRQRVFGDYMQIKSAGLCFDGGFTGNGAAFGRTISNNDPIFFQACMPSVPFSAFTATLIITAGQFDLSGSFNLGAASNGINPLVEPVTLSINTFTIAIPPGSFTSSSPGNFSFNGVIGGVPIAMSITHRGGNTYAFNVIGNTNLNIPRGGTATVTLTIGDDSGTTLARF
jgi:hypothetical protein